MGVKSLRKYIEFSIITNERKCDGKICFLHIIRRVAMDLQAMQAEFDHKKWLDSVTADEDQCGKYDFCVRCTKAGKYPCAKAMLRHEGKYIRLAIIRRRK
jgi:hypothetical protein